MSLFDGMSERYFVRVGDEYQLRMLGRHWRYRGRTEFEQAKSRYGTINMFLIPLALVLLFIGRRYGIEWAIGGVVLIIVWFYTFGIRMITANAVRIDRFTGQPLGFAPAPIPSPSHSEEQSAQKAEAPAIPTVTTQPSSPPPMPHYPVYRRSGLNPMIIMPVVILLAAVMAIVIIKKPYRPDAPAVGQQAGTSLPEADVATSDGDADSTASAVEALDALADAPSAPPKPDVFNPEQAALIGQAYNLWEQAKNGDQEAAQQHEQLLKELKALDICWGRIRQPKEHFAYHQCAVDSLQMQPAAAS